MAVIFAANGNVITASWLILAAMIFDFLDGLSARLLKSYSELGKELDSLADVVSFGVAPALIIYQLLAMSAALTGYEPSSGIALNIFIIKSVPVIMPVCAALRLAKFNTDTTQTSSFKGLPTPANALAVISLIIADHYTDSTIINRFAGSPAALITFTVILSLLMVSRLPMLSLKLSNLKFRGNEGRSILFGLVCISLVILGFRAAPLIIPFYIIVSLVSLIF